MGGTKTLKKVNISKSGLLPKEEKLEQKKKSKKYKIGIPKEIHNDESRVPLTPFAVDLLIKNGHQVIIQSQAGKSANFCDKDYEKYGAKIVKSLDEILKADIIVKIMPLTVSEIKKLKGNQILISNLHLANSTKEYFDLLVKKRITAIAYEYIKDTNDCFPIVRSMSDIAGRTSMLIAAEYLSNVHNGKGEMLGGITGINPTEVIIIGAGTAGESATRMALGLGAFVKVFDTSIHKLHRLKNNLGQQVFTAVYQPKVLNLAIKTADVVIGAVKYIDEKHNFFVTEEMIKKMKKNSVVVDISIDQGGCFETSKLTTHSKPVFVKHGVIHYCVPNIPARVARTATYAISNIITPFLMQIGDSEDIKSFARENIDYLKSFYMYKGTLINKFIAEKFNLDYKDLELLFFVM